MVRFHGVLCFTSGTLIGISLYMFGSYSGSVPLWYYLPAVLIYIACLMILFLRKGYTSDVFDFSGPEAGLAFFYKSPATVRKLIMSSGVVVFISILLSVFTVMNRNGDPDVAIFMLQILLSTIGYVLLVVATVFDLSETQDTSYGS